MNRELETLNKEVQALEEKLSTGAATLSASELKAIGGEYNQKKELLSSIEEKLKLDEEIRTTKELLNDPDYKEEATAELVNCEAKLERVKKEIQLLKRPVDPNDSKNVIMEIRAGAGGDEAGIFACDLFRMYSRYAEVHGWNTSLITSNKTDVGGFKEVTFGISGDGAFGKLKYESGVHRVQRIPETEKQGRVHTSTATVAVLPEAEEVDLEISPSDLRIDTFNASGKGGQGVNTTYSAIRITHLPTNTVVQCQDERSQQQNKAQAMKVLRSRILANVLSQAHEERAEHRKSQVGTGDRSEKIRTYNFPQDRLTDHRIKQNWHNLPEILEGNLNPVIETLIEYDHTDNAS
jgi:peptide chain release factor 1